MAKRIQLRRDISSNWDRLNPTLAQGEIGIDLSNKNFKIGDGTSSWESLDFAIVSGKLGRINVDTYIETGKTEDDEDSIYFVNNGEITAEFASELTNFLRSALFTANLPSTDPNSGTVIVQGGVGISEDLYVGASINGGTINGANFVVGINGKFNGNLEGNVFGDVIGDVYNSTGALVLDSGTSNNAPLYTGNVSGNINSTTGSYLKAAIIEESEIDKTNIGANSAAFIRGTRVVATSQFEGLLVGNVNGDVYSNDGNSKILENGTDGTDAVFYGTVEGSTRGSFSGDIFADQSTRKILENGKLDSPSQSGYEPAVFYGNVSGDISSGGTSTFDTVEIDGGRIDNTEIGENVPAKITGTTIIATEVFVGNFEGFIAGSTTGDILSANGDKILDNGVDGTDAWFQGSIKASDGSTILSHGTGGNPNLPTYTPAEFTGNVVGNLTGDVLALGVSTETLGTTGDASIGGDLEVVSNLTVLENTQTDSLSVTVDALIDGNLSVNGGNLSSTSTNFNLATENVETANLFSEATTVNLANQAAGAVTVSIGAVQDQNTVIISSTASGTINLITDVTTGSVNLFDGLTTGSLNIATAGASITNIGGAGSTVNIGTNGGDSTLNILGTGPTGTVTIATNALTANVFNTTATTINLAGAATTLTIGSDTGTTTIKNNLTVDLDTNIKGDLLVDGDLEVKGTLTYLNTTNTDIRDSLITLNKGEIGAGVTGLISGIEVDRGSEDNTSVIWNETDDRWELKLNNDFANLKLMDLDAAGSVTITGGVTINGDITVEDITAQSLTTSLDVTVEGDLVVEGTSDFQDDVTAKDVTVDNLTVNSDVNITGDLNVLADTILANLTIKNAGELRLRENELNGFTYVGLRAPTEFVNSYTLTLPSNKGIDGNILAFNTDGDRLEFISADLFGGGSVSVSSDNGSDLNDGINKPVKTIKRALQIASGLVYDSNKKVTDKKIVVKVASGEYYEDNPIIIPDNVSVVGAGLRAVNLRPLNNGKDMLRVRNGCYFTEITFRDALDVNGRPSFTFGYSVAFDDPSDTSTSRTGYVNMPTTKPTITTSPYVQNCSIISFLGGNGVLVDGKKVKTPNVPFNKIEAELDTNTIPGVPQQGKSMVANAFTMLSFGGTGWRVINDAYAQIVSCFQIFCLNGSYCQSGGYLSITNSATNFGQYALRASGYSANAFDFNKGYVITSGTILGQSVLTAIGFGELPNPHYVIRVREPSYRQAYDLILAWRDELAADLIVWINDQITNSTAPFTSTFTYNTALCERDSKIILDSVAYDVLSGGNSKIIEAAESYNNTTLVALISQKEENIAAFTQLRDLTLVKIAGTGLSSYVQSKFDLLISILNFPNNIPEQVEYSNIGDITNNYKTFNPSDFVSFDSTLVNVATNVINLTNHGLINMAKVSYSNNGNPNIPGLDDEQNYYVDRLNNNQIRLWTDESQTKHADIQGIGVGTHKLVRNVREFFVDEVVSYHKSYQKLILPSNTYTFVPGRDIFGTKTGGTVPLGHHAYVLSWDSTTRELIVSIDVASDSDPFQVSSIITADHSGTAIVGGILVTDVIDQQDYFTAEFKVRSSFGSGGTFENTVGLYEKQIWLHRPSIVNSSSHTWEYAGSGIDYNALPQNGGKTKVEYEQVNDLPGRVYSSGTNELGDFKVGDFIKAENKTGNVTFTNTVSIAELDALKLSIGDVQISELSADVDLGDNEPGGPQHYRLSTQLATRSFIQNRLGPFIDREVTTNNLAGAVPQLNTLGLLNPDVIPPIRNFLVWKTNGYGSRINLIKTVPATNVVPGDISTETYSSVELRFQSTGVDGNGDPIYVTADDFTLVTQPSTGASGRIVGSLNNSNFAVVGSTDLTFAISFNASPVVINGVTYNLVPVGQQPVGTVLNNQTTNWILSEIEPSQFLILNPAQTYNFTGITSVSGSLTKAQGYIDTINYPSNGLVLGVIRALDNINRNNGAGYLNGTFKNVNLTGGSGTGAKGDFTVIGGQVSSFDITSGGSGYTVGNTLGASLTTASGGAGGFAIEITAIENRLYINNVGGVKFSNNEVSDLKDYIEDANATSQFIVSNDTTVINFNANEGVDTVNNTITIPNHGFLNGDPVKYDNNGFAEIGGAAQGPQNGVVYYTKFIDINTIELYTNYNLLPQQKVLMISSGLGTQKLIKSNIDLVKNTIFLASHGYITGTSLRVTGLDLPTNLDDGKIYYVGSVTTNSFTLHEDKISADDSVDGVVFDAVDFQNKGTDNITFTRQNIRVDAAINTSSGKYLNWSISSASSIAANNIISGIISPSRLGIPPANNKTFLRGDSRYAVTVQNLNKAPNSAVNLIGSDFTTSTVNYTLLDVNIIGIAGQFTCTSVPLDIGYIVTVTGTNTGTGNIIDYSSPTQYKISITNESTTFTLININNSPIVTQPGTTIGLTFTMVANVASNYFNSITLDVDVADGQESLSTDNGAFTNLGVARYNRSQFDVGTGNGKGNITIKDLVINAGQLDNQSSSYYLNPGNLNSAVPVSKGGTNIGSYTVGDMIYASDLAILSKLPIGDTNEVLVSSGSAPYWSSTLILNNLVVNGQVNVTGSSSTLNAYDIKMDDNNIELGSVEPIVSRTGVVNYTDNGSPQTEVTAPTAGMIPGMALTKIAVAGELGDFGYNARILSIDGVNQFTCISTTFTLSNVMIGTGGQFTCDTVPLAVNQIVTVTGTLTGSGTITGYFSPRQYKIAGIVGTTQFTIITTDNNPVNTTAGTALGLTFVVATLPKAGNVTFSVGGPSDFTADNGGITIKSTVNKTLTWVKATDSWTSSENMDIVANKVYKIDGVNVLSSNTVLGKELTSDVGKIVTSGSYWARTFAFMGV